MKYVLFRLIERTFNELTHFTGKEHILHWLLSSWHWRQWQKTVTANFSLALPCMLPRDTSLSTQSACRHSWHWKERQMPMPMPMHAESLLDKSSDKNFSSDFEFYSGAMRQHCKDTFHKRLNDMKVFVHNKCERTTTCE